MCQDLGSSFTMRAKLGPLVKKKFTGLTLQLKITDQNCYKSKTGNQNFGKSKTGHQFCVEKY